MSELANWPQSWLVKEWITETVLFVYLAMNEIVIATRSFNGYLAAIQSIWPNPALASPSLISPESKKSIKVFCCYVTTVTNNQRDRVVYNIVFNHRDQSTVVSTLNESLAELKNTVQALSEMQVFKDELSAIKRSVQKTQSWADKVNTPPKFEASTPQSDLMEVKHVFNYLNVDCEVNDIERVGN